MNLGTGGEAPKHHQGRLLLPTGSLMPDGSFVSIAGFQLGVASMRSFQSCTDGSCEFELLRYTTVLGCSHCSVTVLHFLVLHTLCYTLKRRKAPGHCNVL